MTDAGNEQAPRGSRALDADEVRAIVERNFWAVLSTVDGNVPYSVPVIYGYEGAFYAVLREGRKVRSMEHNPNVCMTIVEVQDLAKTWRSVLASGRAEFVATDDEMRAAIAVIRAQYPGLPTRSGATMEGLRSQGFRVMRMVVTGMTGRAQG